MRKNKAYSIALSLLIAFGLWLYVVTTVSQEDDATFYNIPIVLEGEASLAEKNLMITGQSSQTVALHLSGARSDLNKVNSGNITVKVNLANIDEPGERIPLSYSSISYPGDVPNNAFVVESRSPGQIYLDVDYRRTKEVQVKVKYTGNRSEEFLYDTENATLDNAAVNISGPAAVVDQITDAIVEVDLTERTSSISEGFRYTLCDKDGEPVDAAQITTNLEEIHLDLPIQKIREVQLKLDVIYGGGANAENTTIVIEPRSLRVTGGQAVLDEFGDSHLLGTLNLADLDRPTNEQTFPIILPEGITNQTGVTEAKVKIKFAGLKIKEFTVEDIQMVNVPEGLNVELISTNLTVKVRGLASQIDKLTAGDITATVDFSNAEPGTATYRATVSFSEGFTDLGALKTVSVSATVQEAEE